VGRQFSVNYWSNISIRKNEGRRSYQYVGGLLTVVVGRTLSRNMAGYRAKELSSSLMTHMRRIRTRIFGTNFSKRHIGRLKSSSPLPVMAVQPRPPQTNLHHLLSETMQESHYAPLTMVMASVPLGSFSRDGSLMTSLIKNTHHPSIVFTHRSSITSLRSPGGMWEQSKT
jgi:hypothetical protein